MGNSSCLSDEAGTFIFRYTSDIANTYFITGEQLGASSYGYVRRAIHQRSGKNFAVKSILKSQVPHQMQLQREIETLRRISHPNIINFEDIFEDTRWLHLVFPIYSGGELFDRIAEKNELNQTFSEAEAALLIRKILDAVAYCHCRGVVHRDIKPENFLFETNSKNAEIKLIDFGLARFTASDEALKSRVGTPYYLAPEVLDGNYTMKCDVWSIGIILYILLCGSTPFNGNSEVEILRAIKYDQVCFSSMAKENLSTLAQDLILSLLQKDPECRPAAKDALAHAWFRFALRTSEKTCS